MINKEILQEIGEKTKKSQSRIYKIIQDRKKQYNNTISLETAANLVAAEVGIDISKMLSGDELREVRTLIGKRTGEKAIKIVKKDTETRVVKIGPNIKLIDPKLPKVIISDAQKMAKVYPMLYIFENSIRSVVVETMEKKFGKDWWKQVTPKVAQKVETRKNEEKDKRWHGKRAAHEIYYTNMDDLKSIIISNWSLFKNKLYKQSWIDNMMDVITTSRNIIAHNNPLSNHDIQRIEIAFKDWIKQVRI